MADDLAVVVMGTGRSGTSTVAGLLAAAGVHFGDNLRVNRNLAAKGLFEDNVLHRLNRQIARNLDGEYSIHVETRRYPVLDMAQALDQYAARLGELRAGGPVWGVKDPYLAIAWPEVGHLYGNCRVVAVHRSRAAIVASLRRASNRELDVTERMVTHLLARFYNVLDTLRRPLYHIDYGRLIADPPGQAGALLRWLNVPGLDPAAAAEFVEPGLRHFDPNGAPL